jgi:glycosyltransferase involved in cell wall biosynthesis
LLEILLREKGRLKIVGTNHIVKPRLSILLPAHSASKTIGLAVLSTLAFMPRGSELLVFLDGSNTKSKVLSWASKNSKVRVFQSEEALGISGALNTLIEKSESELIARMDADDICLPWRFTGSIRRLSNNFDDFIFTNTILFGRTVRPFWLSPHLPVSIDDNQAKWLLWLGNPFAHPTMITKKSCLLALGGYRDSLSEDYDLWLRAAVAGFRLRRLRRHGLLYRIHAGQHTQQKNFEYLVGVDPLLGESRKAFNQWLTIEAGDYGNKDLTQVSVNSLAKSKFGMRLQMYLSARQPKPVK